MDEKQLSFLVRQPETSRRVNLGPNLVTFLISGEETGGNFSLTEFEAAPPPAPAAPLHIHQDSDETIFVLEGEFEVKFGGQTVAVHPGTAVFVPKGSPHNIANVGATRGRILVFLNPPGFEGYWNEMSRLMQEHGGQVTPELALATQKKYQVDMLGQTRSFSEH